MPGAGTSEMLQWRTQVLSAVLLVGLVLGGLTAIPSISLAIREQSYAIVVMDVFALCWIVCLWRIPQLGFQFRAWNFVGLLYLLGIFFLLKVGPVSQIYLMAYPVMTALLIGLRPALYGLLLNFLSLLGIGYLASANLHIDHLSGQPFIQWLVISLNFSFISAVITISCGVLLQKLEQSLKTQSLVAQSLKDEQANLRAASAVLRLNAAALSRLNDMVMIFRVSPERQPQIVFVNEAFERLTGYALVDVMGHSVDLLSGKATQQQELSKINEALEANTAVRSELISYTKAGAQFWMEIELVPLADAITEISHWVAIGRDVSERKKSEEHIYRLAYFDVLTNLPNRRLLLDRLHFSLATAQRTGLMSAVLSIDLDHFKNINDARGHATGNAMLVQVAQRIKALIREADTVARVGGDEFVVLIANTGSDLSSAAVAAQIIAEKIRSALALPFQLDGQNYLSGCSIGVAIFPKAAQTPDDLLREADTAMNRVKSSGRNQIAFFEKSMQLDVERHITLQRDLSLALSEGQLQMVMQAQVNCDGQPEGAELLMRWTHPERGAVSPALFIPIAEDSGLIVQLGDWAIEQACLALLRLSQCGWSFPLSVNVSPKQFRQVDFVEKIQAVLARTGAPASRLILEVTEGLLIHNLQDTIERMQILAGCGIRFSIDDFGTGYSSLSYLKRLPLYELKIDRSFVQDMPNDVNDTAIVKMILSMADHLGLRVVAEGVETQEQADFLMQNGCACLQGYLYCRPIALEHWLAQQALTHASGA
ncbi:hypothetical protein BH11PSE12_BH11PSE12_11570 [soil metagenome]